MSPTTSNTSPIPKVRILSSFRRRAPKACIACRLRKVRCDVTIKGTPCTNCSLDSKTCVIKERASRRRLPRNDEMVQISNSARPLQILEKSTPHPDVQAIGRGPPPEPSSKIANGGEAYSGQGGCHEQSLSFEEESLREATPVSDGYGIAFPCHTKCQEPLIDTGEHANLEAGMPSNRNSIDPELSLTYLELPHSSCTFLTLCNMTSLSPQDATFLEARGCLRIPKKPILDEFMRQYFLHVHPLLPILDEGTFWSTYKQDHLAEHGARTSLLVFQAMLFASCSFVSEAVIRTIGFKSIRSARSTFYRKAKMLYDFNIESSSIAITQAALLLTFWSPPEMQPSRPNTMWLTIALHHARCSNAHKAWERPTAKSESAISAPPSEQGILKRLWWCCMIRDRFLALGLRRSIQIVNKYPVLHLADFEYEMDRSEVHTMETKRHLVRILLRVMSLCNTLTDLLTLASLSDKSSGIWYQDAPKLKECKDSLRNWHTMTKQEVSFTNNSGLRQHSVLVHTNLMYMFFFASQYVIPHQEVLLAYSQNGGGPLASPSVHRTQSQEVQEAVMGITNCLSELLQLDLVRYLPLSAVAFATIPLLLNILDAKISPLSEFTPGPTTNKHRLRVLMEAMRSFQPRYDGVEWITKTIHHVVHVTEIDSTFLKTCGTITSWEDLLMHEPDLYLHLVLTIDLSLNHVKVPDDQDFPVVLRPILEATTSDLDISIQGVDKKSPSPQVAGAQPDSTAFDGAMGTSHGQVSKEDIPRGEEDTTGSQANDDFAAFIADSLATEMDIFGTEQGEELLLGDMFSGSPLATISIDNENRDGSVADVVSPHIPMEIVFNFDTEMGYQDLGILDTPISAGLELC